jgi:hypothetical protein
MGGWHHRLYQAGKSNNTLRLVHVWFGRFLMVAGMINGGLGVDLAANSGNKVYGSVAGIVGVLYVGLIVASYITGSSNSSVKSSDVDESGERAETYQVTLSKEEK